MTQRVDRTGGAPERGLAGASWAGAMAALGVASCCVAPMTLMLFGLGGSWLAVFGRIAAASYAVLAVSAAVLGLAWIVAWRRGALRDLRGWLAGSTGLTLLAWLVVSNEARINDYLIGLM